MAYDHNTITQLLAPFTHQAALRIVYHLARAGAPVELYEDAARILTRAAEDKAAGRNPGDRVRFINNTTLEEV